MISRRHPWGRALLAILAVVLSLASARLSATNTFPRPISIQSWAPGGLTCTPIRPELTAAWTADPRCVSTEVEIAIEVLPDGSTGRIRTVNGEACGALHEAIRLAVQKAQCRFHRPVEQAGWAQQRFRFELEPLIEVTEAEVRAEYDSAAQRFAGQQEYAVRHILVNTEAEARTALQRLQGGESFEALATALSIDPSSAKKGGDLGWSLSSHFIPEFAQAMRELAPKGRSAQPVKSQFGWHLIEVLEVRARPFPAYEQVRERIVQILRKRKADAGPTPTRP